MTDGELYRRMRAFLEEECALMALASTTSVLYRSGGIVASIVPAAPDRSILNWVVYDEPRSLVAGYEGVAEAFENKGVRAWNVWVDPQQEVMARFLAERGHILDAEPIAMAAEMSDLRLPDPADLEWERSDDLGIMGRVNDKAYELPPPAFEAALDQWPDGRWHGYLARLEGVAVGTVMTCWAENGDCGVAAVATTPGARGRGIAKRLMAVALREARQAGSVTTSLQASDSGAPVYSSLGYRRLGVMSMWEYRKPSRS